MRTKRRARQNSGNRYRKNIRILTGLFCTSSTVAVQVLDNLAEEQKVEIVSFDADKEQLKAVRDGRLAGTICQNPRGMGLYRGGGGAPGRFRRNC